MFVNRAIQSVSEGELRPLTIKFILERCLPATVTFFLVGHNIICYFLSSLVIRDLLADCVGHDESFPGFSFSIHCMVFILFCALRRECLSSSVPGFFF